MYKATKILLLIDLLLSVIGVFAAFAIYFAFVLIQKDAWAGFIAFLIWISFSVLSLGLTIKALLKLHDSKKSVGLGVALIIFSFLSVAGILYIICKNLPMPKSNIYLYTPPEM